MARDSGVDAVLASLDGYLKQKTERAVAAVEYVMLALEAWAKTEHTFTNQTGNTANSIKGFVAEASPILVRGILSAGMDYDVFLELAREGKWAFLLPTLVKHKGDVMTMLAQQLAGQGSSVGGSVGANPEAGELYEAHRTSTREERRADPEGARKRDMAYRDAVRAKRKGSAP